MKVPPELDAITDKVLAYNPSAPKGPLKVIAGAPDRPLVIGDIEIPCYVLEDERRVLQQTGLLHALNLSHGGSYSKGGDRLAKFASQKRLKQFVNNEITDRTDTPIRFRPPTGGMAYGYEATVLADLCEAVLAARSAGVLQKQQQHVAERCETLMRGFARVGIIALVDEATGYQEIREKRALATILERYIAEDLQPWTRTFPFEFYAQICRLRGWPSVFAIKRPKVIGVYTNDFVYDRIAPALNAELRRRNPTLPSGGRKHKHHQWFTPEHGHPRLREHLAGVMALMRAASSWRAFRQDMDAAYPKFGSTYALPLDQPND